MTTPYSYSHVFVLPLAATVALCQQVVVVTYYQLAYRIMALSYSYSHVFALPFADTVALCQQVVAVTYYQLSYRIIPLSSSMLAFPDTYFVMYYPLFCTLCVYYCMN